MRNAFPNGAFRFADKSRESRAFFCATKQGNSRTQPRTKDWTHSQVTGMAQRFLAGVREFRVRQKCTLSDAPVELRIAAKV